MAKKKKAKKRKKKKPSSNGKHGRNKRGQFDTGNKIGIGNRGNVNEKARELKEALLAVVTKKDITVIAKKMVAEAKKGERHARNELFDRLWGRAIQEVDLGENAANTLVDIVARMCGHGSSTD